MIKFASLAVVALLLVVGVSASVNAQTSSFMPVLYDGNSNPVNTSGTLGSGWYFTQSGTRVYYYGNGYYYDPTTGMFSGSTSNTSGLAGAAITSSTAYPGSPVDQTPTVTPGVPNTGLGGNAMANWALILTASILTLIGGTYILRQTAFR